MTRFFTPLRYENIDGTMIKLVEDFEFHTSIKEVIRVPTGFECDAQSMPRLLWAIDTPQGQGGKAGVVHDYLYWMNGRPLPSGLRFNRKRADGIYREALIVAGLNRFASAVRYYALRAFGWAAWNTHARRIQKEMSVQPLVKKI